MEDFKDWVKDKNVDLQKNIADLISDIVSKAMKLSKSLSDM